MVSLHACGRLSPTLMQHFCLLEEDGVCALICIGCCYHKLATGGSFLAASMFRALQCIFLLLLGTRVTAAEAHCSK